MYRKYESHSYSPYSKVAMVIIRAKAGVILKFAWLLSLKGYFMFLITTNVFYLKILL